MGSYTVRDEPTIDTAVRSQLDRVVERFVAAGGPKVRAILITGGFGRGEGSVVVDPETGPRPLNDYDMVVIQRGRRSPAIEAAA